MFRLATSPRDPHRTSPNVEPSPETSFVPAAMVGGFASDAVQSSGSPAMKETTQVCIGPTIAVGGSVRGRGEAVGGFTVAIGRS